MTSIPTTIRKNYLLAGGSPYRGLDAQERLTAMESKLLAYCTTRISRKDPLGVFRVTYTEFYRFLDTFPMTPEHASEFYRIAEGLMKKKLMLPVSGREGGTDKLVARWFRKMIIHEEAGYIEVSFSPEVAEQLVYGDYPFEYPATSLVRLTSAHSISLYEFIKAMQQLVYCTNISLTVEELGHIIGVPGDATPGSTQSVISHCCGEVGAHTDIRVVPTFPYEPSLHTHAVELHIHRRLPAR